MIDALREYFMNIGSGWTLAQFVFTLVLPSLGFLLALALLSQILREGRAPANAMAWLVTIMLMPYVGVPLYLMLGKRKTSPSRRQKPTLRETRATPAGECCDEHVLLSHVASGVYPSTTGNRAALMGDGVKTFHTLIERIGRAQRNVHIATYILGDDVTGHAILDALCERLDNGVEVYLLLDAYGSFAVSKRSLAPYRKAGGKVAFFMPMLRTPLRGRMNWRNHRKMILIDEQVAMTGGMNLAEEYMGATPLEDRWNDLLLMVEGPAVTDFYEVFRADWKFACGEQLPEVYVLPLPQGDGCEAVAQVVASGPDVEGDPLHEAILTGMYAARKRLWVVTPYFLPDGSLLRGLMIAAHRGVDVRLITPKHSNHPVADVARGSYLRQLEAEGVSIVLSEGPMMHAKAVIVDEAISIVGSANVDMRSMFLNYEIALCTNSTVLVDELVVWVERIMEQSTVGMQKQGGPRELLEGIGRLLAPLL